MNDAARALYARSERLWALAERAERDGATRDIIDTHRRDAVWCRIAADLQRRQEVER